MQIIYLLSHLPSPHKVVLEGECQIEGKKRLTSSCFLPFSLLCFHSCQACFSPQQAHFFSGAALESSFLFS